MQIQNAQRNHIFPLRITLVSHDDYYVEKSIIP